MRQDTTRTELARHATPTGIERRLAEDEIIVSKTDRSGRILYANDVFLQIAGYTEREVLGMPHSIVRHPDMPRCAFALLWETIAAGSEIFAYVVNLAKNGDHYWVFAHVTPTLGSDGRIVGYHSSRRSPNRRALEVIEPLYRELVAVEQAHGGKQEGIAASRALLERKLAAQGVAYDELMFLLENEKEA